jgi:signal transduction histidine kinase
MICETYGWEFGALWMVGSETHELTTEGIWFADYTLSDYADRVTHSTLSENEVSLLTHVIHSPQLLWLSSVDKIRSRDADQVEKAGLKSGFLLPISHNSKIIAVMECLAKSVRSQDQDLIEMLNAVGSQIGIFLERKILEESLAHQADQQRLLAQIGIALSKSLDYTERLKSFMDLVVPEMADWCAVDIIDKENILERMSAAHVDPTKIPLVYALQPKRAVDFSQAEDKPQVRAFLSGQSILFKDISPSLIKQIISDPEQLDRVRQLNPRSSIIVPLLAQERILGACTFVRLDGRRGFSERDLLLAEDIGRRLGLALDNAFLYAEAQKSNLELERQVEERTSQLKVAINQLTNQISERKYAEEQVKSLNVELEQRIQERTFELEIANHNLTKEVAEHQKASLSLRNLLKRTRELYQISQAIGTVREPNEVLRVLLSSSYLKNISRASIAILEKPWVENQPAPRYGLILAEWNKGSGHPKFLNQRLTLEELGVLFPAPFGKPIIIQDIQSIGSLSESVHKRFASLGTHSLIILPLIAGGEWYGLLSLHFRTHLITNLDDLRHVRGLVDETAIAIKNMRLLETEANARHEAEIANELKLKFLAMISHELRTPLASIKGFATTLLSEDVVWTAEKQRDFLQTIDSEADKLTDLIEQLLDLSRIEAGTLRILPKKQLFHNIVDSALSQIQALTSKHRLVFDIPLDLPPLHVDKQRITQVLTNLITNSVKFSPPLTQITISAHPTLDNRLQVDVSDEGIGIPLEKRERIFEAFQQLENESAPNNKGAGLGLAICKGLIEAHGGDIWVQDQPGPGATISFSLPAAPQDDK